MQKAAHTHFHCISMILTQEPSDDLQNYYLIINCFLENPFQRHYQSLELLFRASRNFHVVRDVIGN